MSAALRSPLRVVLIDFDWQDGEVMMHLVNRPDVAIRLVIGPSDDNGGLRMAELGGLPWSSDLGDLTREVFDLAVISERSPRQNELVALLQALGTPIRTIESLAQERGGSHGDAPAGAHRIGAQGERDVQPVPEQETGLADRVEIESTIQELAALTGALHAELRLEGADGLEVAVRVGTPDTMADLLAALASAIESEQVIRMVRGVGEGRCYGAWPIRTPRGLALLTATGMDPNGPWEEWNDFAVRLRDRWTRPEPAAVEAPLATPAPHGSWQSSDRFRQDLERAIAQTGEAGLRYSLHRFRFAARGPDLEELFELLPRHLRSNDLLCRPEPQTLLLLTAAAPDAFFRLNQRILELWEGCWRMSEGTAPDPRVDIESVELLSADGGLEFLDRASRWLAAA